MSVRNYPPSRGSHMKPDSQEQDKASGTDVSRPSADSQARAYLRENYRPSNRLAVVAINKRSGAVVQRIAAADRVPAGDFQRWLHYMNDHRYEVYVSMNALPEESTGRTKADVGETRHICLELDEGGEAALRKILDRQDLPNPNHVVSSSPGRYQVIWKAEGFSRDQAEAL